MNTPIADLHCHILPGIDDGAGEIEETLALLRQELSGGVTHIMFTPHFYYERDTVDDFCARRSAAFDETLSLINKNNLDLTVNFGAEVYYTPALPFLDLQKLVFHGTNYILIELPTRHQPSGVDEVLYNIECMGYVPIIAHVERYPYVADDPTLLYEWVSGGALAHINASPMIRGGKTSRQLRKYIDWGLIHFMCSDAHSVGSRPANLAAGLDAIPEMTAKEFSENAYAVFSGGDVLVTDISKPKRSLFGKWV